MLIPTSVVSLLALIVAWPAAVAQVVAVHYDGISHAELIGPGDPRHGPLSSDILSSSGLNATVERFKGSGVLLVNNSTEPVLGYAIRWEIAGPSGEPLRFNRMFWQRLSLAAATGEVYSKDRGKVRDAYLTVVIAPRDARFLSPFFNLSRHTNVARFGAGGSSFGPPDFDIRMQAAIRIDVTLDSVVYADGLCEGPDVLNLCNQINGELDAARSIVGHVNQLQASGVSPAGILDDLSRIAGEPDATVQLQHATPMSVREHPARNAAHEEWVNWSRDVLIDQALRIRKRRGDAAALSMIQECSTSFRTHREPSAR